MIEQSDSPKDKDPLSGFTFLPSGPIASHVLKVAAIS